MAILFIDDCVVGLLSNSTLPSEDRRGERCAGEIGNDPHLFPFDMFRNESANTSVLVSSEMSRRH